MEIVEFLEARITDDETAAQAAMPDGSKPTGPRQWQAEPWRDADIHDEPTEWVVASSPALADGLGSVDVAHCHGWPRDQPDSWWNPESPNYMQNPPAGPSAQPHAEHIARWDPARVLAECAAKRARLQLHRDYGDGTCRECCGYYPCPTARIDLQVWAGHPDFDPTWRG